MRLLSQEWAELCTKDLYNSLLVVLDLILALSGLPGAVTEKDLEAILVQFFFAVDRDFFAGWFSCRKKKHAEISLEISKRFATMMLEAEV